MSDSRPSPHAFGTVIAKARRATTSLRSFPGELPTSLNEAYGMQLSAVAAWNDQIVGWKVGRITGEDASRLGADRFVGPLFARDVVEANITSPTPFPLIEGGFGALEVEFVMRLGADAPAGMYEWTPTTARDIIDEIFIGIEVAGSPIAALGQMEPLASIAAFGNNMALILGAAVPEWKSGAFEQLNCTAIIDGHEVGRGSAENLPGGPFTALAFALNQAARLGHPLTAGQLVSTGAVTGVHPVVLGMKCVADFGMLGRIDCHVSKAQAALVPMSSGA